MATKTKFKKGDKVIGNKRANKRYGITKEGWKGTVTKVYPNGRFDTEEYSGLDPYYFNKVTTRKPAAKKPDTVKYSVDEAFILEAYGVANSEMKAKLKKKFPEAFKDKEIEFGEKFTLTTHGDNDIYIGKGFAPRGLAGKCLIVKDDVKVSIKTHDGRKIIIFTKG